MKKQLLLLTISFFSTFYGISQIINFDDQGLSNFDYVGNPYSITNNGETFIMTITNGGATVADHRYRTTDTEGCGNTSLSYIRIANASADAWTIETQSGNRINLGSIRFLNMWGCPTYGNYSIPITVEGFQNNVSTGTQSITVTNGNTTFNSNSNFDDVDKIVITGTDILGLGIDDINWVISTLSIGDASLNEKFQIFPNPSSDFIQITNFNESKAYSIHNVLGAEIVNGNIINNNKIDIRSLKRGIYFLRFENGYTTKFIKE